MNTPRRGAISIVEVTTLRETGLVHWGEAVNDGGVAELAVESTDAGGSGTASEEVSLVSGACLPCLCVP